VGKSDRRMESSDWDLGVCPGKGQTRGPPFQEDDLAVTLRGVALLGGTVIKPQRRHFVPPAHFLESSFFYLGFIGTKRGAAGGCRQYRRNLWVYLFCVYYSIYVSCGSPRLLALVRCPENRCLPGKKAET